MGFGFYPLHPEAEDCLHYLKTGYCKFGMGCIYNHPQDREEALERRESVYPQRIGQPLCQYYLRAGICKFGHRCNFHHPRDSAEKSKAAKFNELGYPLRPDAEDCSFYLKTRQCMFGYNCKFNHPEPSDLRFLSPAILARQSYPGGPSSFIASPHWQGSSSYARPSVHVPSWNTSPASSSKSQQQMSGNGQFVGTSRHSSAMGSSSVNSSPFQFGSFQTGGSSSFFQSGSSQNRESPLKADQILPFRPGFPECPFYNFTGECKFGANCRFHHPRESQFRAPDCVLSRAGLPLRPGKPQCSFYSSNGFCKDGKTCKFDHSIADPKGIGMDYLSL